MTHMFRTLLLAASLLAVTGSAADNDRWIKLGQLHVTDRRDRDTVSVGVKKGRFEAIRLGAKGRDVQFHDLKVHFANGDVQDVRVRNVVKAGAWTRAIDLDGDRRGIEKIVMVYDAQTKRLFKGATVVVHGQR